MYRFKATSKANASFTPPGRVNQPGDKVTSTPGRSNPDDVESLKTKEMELDTKIKALEDKGYREDEIKDYIQLLHEYNEIKDAAQQFMGRIALLEGVTNREVSVRFNAPKSE